MKLLAVGMFPPFLGHTHGGFADYLVARRGRRRRRIYPVHHLEVKDFQFEEHAVLTVRRTVHQKGGSCPIVIANFNLLALASPLADGDNGFSAC